MKFKFQCLKMKFDWNIAMLGLCIGCVCFCDTVPGSGRVVAAVTLWSAEPKIFTLWLFIEDVCLPTPDV